MYVWCREEEAGLAGGRFHHVKLRLCPVCKCVLMMFR